MIKTTTTNPTTLSFVQKGVESENSQRVAGEQILKASQAEVVALSEVENANFRLEKATATLKATEIAYFESVSKSAWNKEELRSAYNNALAGFRDADKAAKKASENFELSKSALAGLRAMAKGQIPNNYGQMVEDGPAQPEDQETEKEDDIVEVEPKMIMNQNGVMVPDFSLTKSFSDGPAVMLDASGQPDDSSDDDDSSDYPENPDVTCPACMGEGCDGCGTGFIPLAVFIGALSKSAENNPFDTDELLTKEFQKSEAYQDYIFKGGAGSGAQPGHSFNGNQWTGGARSFPRLGIKEGWKQTMSRYAKGAEASKAAADAHEALAQGHLAVGRTEKAAEELRTAAKMRMQAAGNHEGIAGIHAKETGDDAARSEQRGLAAVQRTYAGRLNAQADALQSPMVANGNRTETLYPTAEDAARATAENAARAAG